MSPRNKIKNVNREKRILSFIQTYLHELSITGLEKAEHLIHVELIERDDNQNYIKSFSNDDEYNNYDKSVGDGE